jgi:hypothetical protein
LSGVLQLHCWYAAPGAVLTPATSRHLPLCTACRRKPAPCVEIFHFWLSPPLHVHWTMRAPFVVLAPLTSMQRPLFADTRLNVFVPTLFSVQIWFLLPVHPSC